MVVTASPTSAARWRVRALLEQLRRPERLAVLMGALVFLPMLGASGLWDPWETHYAEVARRIVVDGDWITPRWQGELFFSKPILNFWLMAASFHLFGISAWAARLPFALIGILGVFLAFRFVSRILDARRGLWAAFALCTTPFYFFISRQAITDITFCVFVMGSLASFALVALKPDTPRREALYIYVFAGLAALAKTPIGLAIPAAVALVYLLLTGEWSVLRRLRLPIGILLFFLIAAPWYVSVLALHGRKFSDEFFMHHNLQRAFTGVHGERGTFEYFIQQAGYGFFPWVGLLPLMLGRVLGRLGRREDAEALRLEVRSPEAQALRLELFLLIWFGVTFTVFTLIVTKFHHYVFPALPPLAILAGICLASEDGPGWRVLGPLGILPLLMVGNDIVSSDAHLANLYTYAYERPLPGEIYPRLTLALVAGLFGLCLLLWRFLRTRLLRAAMALLAAASALTLAWYYQPALGHTMSQQDVFDTYRRLARPGERLYQYQMNWRGEVFYSNDKIVKIGDEAGFRSIFTKPERAFMIAVRESLGPLDRSMRQATGRHVHVLEGSGLRYVLLSNQIGPGETDHNPLTRHLLSEIPALAHPVRAELVDPAQAAGGAQIAFLGYELRPEVPSTGDELEVTLYFQCLRRVDKSWQIFIHIDGFGHEFHRINGDHYPVEGLLTTDQWMPGDIVRDRVRLKVPIEFTAKSYTLYLGFYIGETRMRVLPGFPQDGSDRIRAGTFAMD